MLVLITRLLLVPCRSMSRKSNIAPISWHFGCFLSLSTKVDYWYIFSCNLTKVMPFSINRLLPVPCTSMSRKEQYSSNILTFRLFSSSFHKTGLSIYLYIYIFSCNLTNMMYFWSPGSYLFPLDLCLWKSNIVAISWHFSCFLPLSTKLDYVYSAVTSPIWCIFNHQAPTLSL